MHENPKRLLLLTFSVNYKKRKKSVTRYRLIGDDKRIEGEHLTNILSL